MGVLASCRRNSAKYQNLAQRHTIGKGALVTFLMTGPSAIGFEKGTPTPTIGAGFYQLRSNETVPSDWDPPRPHRDDGLSTAPTSSSKVPEMRLISYSYLNAVDGSNSHVLIPARQIHNNMLIWRHISSQFFSLANACAVSNA